MAYATLLSVTQSLEQILHSDDQSLILHETEQQIIRSLQEKANVLLSFLENDSLKYSECELEPRIRNVAYKAEAMIESGFPYKNRSETKMHSFWGIISMLLSVIPWFHQILNVIPWFHHRAICLELGHQILKSIVEELDSILEKVVKMKERNKVKDLLPPTKSLPSASSKLGSIDKTDVVGLHKEMMEIKDRLTGSPFRREIITIVGMPGIGKTTLTKTLYEDPLIVKHFDVRAWITVSHDYHQQRMLTDLLACIQDINHGSDLANRLHKTLKRRRYLIVLDDVWDTNAWDQIKRFVPDDNNGSRVILTTRLQDVAIHVECPDSIYRLNLLSPDDCWKLLHQKVFKAEHCPPKLEDVGKEIANNCKGLPLSLAVIGGILYKGKRTLHYWRYVAQNVDSALNNTYDQVMNVISLSYKSLPHHLRACFLYMGVFPEDHAISKSKLIMLWVAEGFIKPAPSKSLEATAHEYLENLIDRNMILVREHNYGGGIKKCGIHDLMRDLCMRIGQEEKFLKVVNSELEIPHDYIYNFCRLSVYIRSYSHHCLAGLSRFLPNSVLSSPHKSPKPDLLSRVLSSHNLKVLDAQKRRFFKSKGEIFYLIGLRYISLYDMQHPSSISKLLNLQTLVFTSEDTVTLPLEIWMMPRLRHILTRHCILPHPFDVVKRENFVPLKNLQTLKGLTNFRFSENAIQMMPNLKKLGIIFNLDRSADLSSYYSIGNLILLHQLESLNVHFRDKSNTKYPMPENFSLPPTLKKLTLTGFKLSRKHMGIMGSLQDLEELNLKRISFDGSPWEPTEGEFLQLKSLLIFDTDLEYFIADETNFPILRSLRISYCFRLMEIPSEIGYIETLRLIELFVCKGSAEDSVKLIEKEQQDLGNDKLRIVCPSRNQRRIGMATYNATLAFLGI